jgi:Enoyl-(Acyl carrier protein) reductase
LAAPASAFTPRLRRDRLDPFAELPPHPEKPSTRTSITMTTERLAIALAAAAALVPASAPAYGAEVADNRPANYGTCVAYEAMFGEDPVREFTQSLSPLTAFEYNRTVGPRHPDGGILVNIVAPVFTVTERNLATFGDEVREMVRRRTPSRRLPVPQDIASAIVYLGSPANGNITGAYLPVAGGTD